MVAKAYHEGFSSAPRPEHLRQLSRQHRVRDLEGSTVSGQILRGLPAKRSGHRALAGLQAGNEIWSRDQLWLQQQPLLEESQMRTKNRRHKKSARLRCRGRRVSLAWTNWNGLRFETEESLPLSLCISSQAGWYYACQYEAASPARGQAEPKKPEWAAPAAHRR